MAFFDDWDIRSARYHLVFLVLLLLAGEGVRWLGRERLPPMGADGEFLPAPAFSGDSSTFSEKEKWIRGVPMDVAKVGEEDLLLLPGVGPDLAERIGAWLRRNGPPGSLDDLRAVKGVGPAKLKVLREYLALPVAPSPAASPQVPDRRD